MYRVVYDKEVVRFLRKALVSQLRKIKAQMELVATSPFTRQPNLTTLKGMTRGYRLRIGNLRLIYEIDTKNKTIIVWKIGFRGSVYRS